MKTIKEWLETLEETYRNEALENMDFKDLDNKVSSASDALFCGFSWDDTKEGYLYWAELHKKLVENEN